MVQMCWKEQDGRVEMARGLDFGRISGWKRDTVKKHRAKCNTRRHPLEVSAYWQKELGWNCQTFINLLPLNTLLKMVANGVTEDQGVEDIDSICRAGVIAVCA